jgi:hypothetical protein
LFPYITIDVFFVGLAFALPLGLLVAAQVSACVSNSAAGLMGFGLIGLSIVVLVVLNLAVDREAWEASGNAIGTFGGGAALRSLFAFLFWVGGMLVAVSIFAGKLNWLMTEIVLRSSGAAIVTSALAAVLMPLVFVQVRCLHGWKRFDELSESTRIGEARSELLTILRLAPNSSWRGRSVTDALRAVRAEYDRIESARQRIPHPPGNAEDALQQARFLAILGKSDLALSYLEQFPAASQSVEAALLRGTMMEARQSWREAIVQYELGKKLLRESGESREGAQELQTALRGEGFCRRKAGDLQGAEQAYLELMRSAPSGSHALLLAYFYEDAQQTSAAQRWSREAVRLEPALREQAELLLEKLSTSHFGCFQVYRERSRQSLEFLNASAAAREGAIPTRP